MVRSGYVDFATMQDEAAIPVAEAQLRILRQIRELDPERVPLSDALGRVLAEPVIARVDIPPWDNSAMDGYAVRAADVTRGKRLSVSLDLPAGVASGASLPRGTVARIMTGAPLPEAADTVVPVEVSSGPGGPGAYAAPGEWVTFEDVPSTGHHVRRRGEDVRQGEIVLEVGALCTPARIALAAAVGRAALSVVRRPRVAIVSTGDELVDVDEAGLPDRIVNGNAYGLAAMIVEATGEPVVMPIVSDDRWATGEAIEAALRNDAVITVGGVSAGERDHVRSALAAVGVELVFWRVAVKPGGPIAFARAPDGRPIFALPGNPVSALVTFELFVRPALLRMGGRRRCFRRLLKARLREPLEATAGKETYVRCRLEPVDGEWRAQPTGPQGSAVLSTLARADGLAIVPRGVDRLESGESVDVLPLGEGVFLREEP